MNSNTQSGFSVAELMCVLVIVGILTAIAVPALTKSKRMAEIGVIFATMRTIGSTQVNIYTAKSRFGDLDEIDALLSGSVGKQLGTNLFTRDRFMIEMVPADPTDVELHDSYTITATQDLGDGGQVYKFELSQTGEIRQILP